MQFLSTSLSDAFLIQPDPISDSRGWFARTYSKEEFKKIGHCEDWVQFNDSYSHKAGTLRGIHFQYPPQSEAKLVRCIAGKAYDVIVDLRANSTTYLKWYSVELSSSNRLILYVPKGFGHSFQTLVDKCEMSYAHTSDYSARSEGAIRYNDPALNIRWPLKVTEISERDRSHPLLAADFKGIEIDK